MIIWSIITAVATFRSLRLILLNLLLQWCKKHNPNLIPAGVGLRNYPPTRQNLLSLLSPKRQSKTQAPTSPSFTTRQRLWSLRPTLPQRVSTSGEVLAAVRPTWWTCSTTPFRTRTSRRPAWTSTPSCSKSTWNSINCVRNTVCRIEWFWREGARSDPLPEIARNIASRNNVLFFDEFQVTDVADAMMMQRLFSNLFSNNVTVISTSNREPDDLYRDGVQRDRFVPFIHLLKSVRSFTMAWDPAMSCAAPEQWSWLPFWREEGVTDLLLPSLSWDQPRGGWVVHANRRRHECEVRKDRHRAGPTDAHQQVLEVGVIQASEL